MLHNNIKTDEPRREKIGFGGSRQGATQIDLYSHRNEISAISRREIVLSE